MTDSTTTSETRCAPEQTAAAPLDAQLAFASTSRASLHVVDALDPPLTALEAAGERNGSNSPLYRWFTGARFNVDHPDRVHLVERHVHTKTELAELAAAYEAVAVDSARSRFLPTPTYQ